MSATTVSTLEATAFAVLILVLAYLLSPKIRHRHRLKKRRISLAVS